MAHQPVSFAGIRAFLVSVALFASLVPCTGAYAVPTPFTYKTDTSWKLVGNVNPLAPAPPAGWNSSATFDDSAWSAATIVVPEQPSNVPVTPFIWDASGWTGATQIVWTRKVIPVTAPILSAVLDCGCDDDMQVFVNGTRVINDTNGSGTGVLGTNIAAYLAQGNNLVAASCVNVQPPNHAFGAIVTLSLDVPTAVPAVSPSALVLLGMALASLGWIALKRG